MNASEEVYYMLEFFRFLGGRKIRLDRSDGVRGPETDKARVVVGTPAAV
jgi:hypothetical protein